VCRDAVEVSLWHGKSARSSGAATSSGWCACTTARIPNRKGESTRTRLVHDGLRDAQSDLNKMLSERNRRPESEFLEADAESVLRRWLEICAKPRLRPKSFQDYEGLLRHYIRPRLGTTPLAAVSGFDIQICHCGRRSRFPSQITKRNLVFLPIARGLVFATFMTNHAGVAGAAVR
jgi:hypothetical protein